MYGAVAESIGAAGAGAPLVHPLSKARGTTTKAVTSVFTMAPKIG